jgi:hypothetical protein
VDHEEGQSENVALLSESEFKATLSEGMVRVEPDDAPQITLGEYFQSIPVSHLEGHDFSARRIETVERAPGERWVHIVLGGATRNVYLVIVVDLNGPQVHGHYLLDLVRAYGLDEP